MWLNVLAPGTALPLHMPRNPQLPASRKASMQVHCTPWWSVAGNAGADKKRAFFLSRRTEMRLNSSACEEGAVLGALQARAEVKGRCWRVLYWAFPEASAEKKAH